MKWYKHDPSAALAGMIGLTVEERGAYYTLIDLQYARAPHNDVTDHLVIKALAVRPQVWRRLKAALIAKGKVHETDGKLTANRVQTEVISARKVMDNIAVLNTRRLEKQQLNLVGAESITTTTTTSRDIEGKPSISPPRRPKRAKTTLPENWHPMIAMENSAEFDRFVDYCKANGRTYSDWDAAWRNWLTSPYRNRGQQKGRGKETPIEQAKRLADEWTRRERAAGIYGPPDDAGGHRSRG